MTTYDGHRCSRYLDYLPPIFQQEEDDFLGRFLLAFEHVLTGVGEFENPGIEEILDGIWKDGSLELAGVHRYFTPGPRKEGDVRPTGTLDAERAPAEFLDWLAGWVALTLREDWDEEEKRRILNETVPAYRNRGTKASLEQVLAAYTERMQVTVSEFIFPFQVGEHSTVGVDTMIGDFPHYFLVRVILKLAWVPDFPKKKEIIRAIIDREKPAHTVYDLQIELPTIQIGVTSEVGISTILGDLPRCLPIEERRARWQKKISKRM